MNEVRHIIHIDADPFDFLLGMYAGALLVLVLLIMRSKKAPAKITPIRKEGEKEKAE